MPQCPITTRLAPRPRGAAGAFLALLVLLLGLPSSTCRANELSNAEWKDVTKKARKMMKEPGRRPQKQVAVEKIGSDNSQRAAEFLVDWTLRSLKMQQKEIADEIEETGKKFKRLDAQLRKAYKKAPRFPPPTWDAKHSVPWKELKGKYESALEKRDVEVGVRFSIGEAFRSINDKQAVDWLIREGLPSVQKAKLTETVQVSIAKGILSQSRKQALPVAIRMAADASRPKLRILALNWFGQHQVKEGMPHLVRGLTASEMAVRRASALAMQGMDDPACVEHLIKAMSRADAQLLAEIDHVLHWYTGKSFESSPSVWKRWWKDEGAAWLADAEKSSERHGQQGEPEHGGTMVRFYGIPTESHHVVFVLDRSGSMETPAGNASKEKKKEKPKGPVTGGDSGKKGKDGDDDKPVAGDTKMEVAINQLKKSVEQLDKKVSFNIVFYSDAVEVWKQPPELMPSSPKNKKDAIGWFEKLKPQGSTQLFDALMKALEYADTIGQDKKKPKTGADTIFLLSDGSPTKKGGKKPGVLSPQEIDEKWAKFKEKNKLYHCVVHTIGIGPSHNRSLMQRIASETGGKYKAVGVN